MSVLVDSSVWIDGAKPNGKAKARLSSLIRGNDIICYAKPIQVEVCQGARSQREFEKVWDAFQGFQLLPLSDYHWELSAWNYFRCRKAGLTVSTMDCLIATVANSYRVRLWTLDKLFEKIKPIVGFDVY
jgi:predicted nucleic acid-binding protein